MIYALIGCLIIIGFLGYKLYQKQVLNRNELKELEEKINQDKKIEEALSAKLIDLQIRCNDARNERILEEQRTSELERNAKEALQLYHDTIDVKMNELNESIEEQRQKRLAELLNELDTHQTLIQNELEEKRRACNEEAKDLEEWLAQVKDNCEKESAVYINDVQQAKEKFEGIERVLRTYDAERQEKLFYTIQLPEEYHDDIDFLLTTVASKVQHPDIISKLVWQEYVKPNLEDTFKRIEIKPEPGIYKLTSLVDCRCYIGKSTNVKNRITDHFKSAIGIKSIADQAVHHAILKDGFWNWQIEVITYCDKERLSELEKNYIEFFKAQDYGYNKTGGG